MWRHSGKMPCKDGTLKLYIYKWRNTWGHQKLGDRYGRVSSLEASEGGWPCQHCDFVLLTSRTLRQYITVALSTQIVVLCYSNPKKLMHCPIQEYPRDKSEALSVLDMLVSIEHIMWKSLLVTITTLLWRTGGSRCHGIITLLQFCTLLVTIKLNGILKMWLEALVV